MIYSDPKQLFSEEAMRHLVNDSEERFEKQLTDLCENVGKIGNLRAIMLSGPTCSGKTTTANKLIRSLIADGKDVYVVSVDDFYYDRMYLMARSEQLGFDVDFESIAAIDLPFFKMCMQSLLEGKKTLIPKYDFKLGRRSRYEAYQMMENSILLVEGIQAIYPEITAVFAEVSTVSIFISVAQSIHFGQFSFDKTEARLVRRLVRDHYHRSSGVEFTFALWKSVTDNEIKSIWPYRDLATYQIDSAMAYEPYMMKDELLTLLKEGVSKESPYYEAANTLICKLKDLPSCKASYLPPESVYHEFIQ